MITISLIVGVLFGLAWGTIFTDRYKRLTHGPSETAHTKTSAWFLASTGVIRYLLLAALLVVLMIKYHLLISWWLGGFLASFWLVLFRSISSIKQTEKTKNL